MLSLSVSVQWHLFIINGCVLAVYNVLDSHLILHKCPPSSSASTFLNLIFWSLREYRHNFRSERHYDAASASA